MKVFDAATLAALNAGRIIKQELILFDLTPDGIHTFWDGIGDFAWNGYTWRGAGSLIEVREPRETTGTETPETTVRLRAVPEAGLTPDVLATMFSYQWYQAPVRRYQAMFHPDTRALLSVEQILAGYVDDMRLVEAPKDRQVYLEGRLQSKRVDENRTGHRVRSDADQRLIDANDGSLRHVATAHKETIYWGRKAK